MRRAVTLSTVALGVAATAAVAGAVGPGVSNGVAPGALGPVEGFNWATGQGPWAVFSFVLFSLLSGAIAWIKSLIKERNDLFRESLAAATQRTDAFNKMADVLEKVADNQESQRGAIADLAQVCASGRLAVDETLRGVNDILREVKSDRRGR